MKYDTDIIINNSSSNSNEEIERTKLRNTSDAHRSFSPLMTDVHPILKQRLVPPSQLPSVQILNVAFCCMEYSFGCSSQLSWLCSLPASCAPSH